MIGWIQAVAFSSLGIAIVWAILDAYKTRKEFHHKQEIKQMEQEQELMQRFEEEP